MGQNKVIDNLYRLHRKYMYYLRKNRDQLEKQNPVFLGKIQLFMAKSERASTAALSQGLTLEQVYKIEQRAFFDALLQRSQEGDLQYQEVFVQVERAPIPDQYDIVSAPGDLPDNHQKGKHFTTFQLTEFNALVNCYYSDPMSHEEALAIVMAMAKGGSLGNYGAVLWSN